MSKINKKEVLYNRPNRASYTSVIRKATNFSVISFTSFLISFTFLKYIVYSLHFNSNVVTMIFYSVILTISFALMRKEIFFLKYALKHSVDKRESMKWGYLSAAYLGIKLTLITVLLSEVAFILTLGNPATKYLPESLLFSFFTVILGAPIALKLIMAAKPSVDAGTIVRYKFLFNFIGTTLSFAIILLMGIALGIVYIDLFNNILKDIVVAPIAIVSYITTTILLMNLFFTSVISIFYKIELSLATSYKSGLIENKNILYIQDEAQMASSLNYNILDISIPD